MSMESMKEKWAQVERIYNDKKLIKKLSVGFFFMGMAFLVLSIMLKEKISFLSEVLWGMGVGLIVVFAIGYLIMYFVHDEDLLDVIFGMFGNKKKKEGSK